LRVKTGLILVGIMLLSGPVFGAEIPKERAVLAIIGEAENQGARGMLAIACAIRNRGHLRGVYGEKAPRVLGHKYSEKTYKMALEAWEASKKGDITGGADHWHNVRREGENYWTRAYKKTFEYKDHVFFNSKAMMQPCY